MKKLRRRQQKPTMKKRLSAVRSRRRLQAESLEKRLLLAGDFNLWQNPHDFEDVNDDGATTALDALLIVNHLNDHGSHELPARVLDLSGGEAEQGPYLDVNGDGFSTPLDYLQVVNDINGEGAAGDNATFRSEITDLQGNPLPDVNNDTIPEIQVGQDFILNAYVQDTRNPTFSRQGVFTAYLEYTYDASLVDGFVKEQQTIRIDSSNGFPTGGTFQLEFNGQTTADISVPELLAANDSSPLIRTALEGLSTINSGDVTVSQLAGQLAYRVTFDGNLVDMDVPDIIPRNVNVTYGGTPPANPVTVTETAKGVQDNPAAFELGTMVSPTYINGISPRKVPGEGRIIKVGGFAAESNGAMTFPDGGPADEHLLMSLRFTATTVGREIFVPGITPVTDTTVGSTGAEVSHYDNPIDLRVDFLNTIDEGMNASIDIVELVSARDDTFNLVQDSGENTLMVLADNGNGADSTANGTLNLEQTLVTTPDNGSAQVSGNNVLYTPNQGFSGTDSFVYRINDGGGNAGDATVTVNVGALNDAPVNTVPGTQIIDEGGSLAFNGNISVADADAGSAEVQVSLSVNNGDLSLGGTSGLTFSAGDGTDDASVTFTGTLVDINTALNGLNYNTTDLNFNGSDTLTITTDDLGNTGLGGAQTDADTVTITVNAVNDPPVNTVPGTQTVISDSTLTFSGANVISVSDIDADASGGVQVSLSIGDGTLSLSGTTGLTFTTGDGTADASMTFTGTTTAVNTALNGLVYTPPASTFGNQTLTVETSDQGNTGSGGTLTDTDTVTITVIPPRAPAVVGDSITQDTGGATIAEADGTVVYTVDVTSNDLNGSAVIGGPNITVTTITQPASGGSVAINGTDINVTPDDNFNGDLVFTYTIEDTVNGLPNDGPDTGTATVTVAPVNDAPSLSVGATSVTIDEDSTYTFSAGGNGLSVDDAADAAFGTVNVQVTVSGPAGSAIVPTSGGATIGGSGSSSVTIDGTLAQANTALEGLTFTPALNSTADATVAITVDDLGNIGGGSLTDSNTVTFTIDPVNDAPVLQLNGSATVANQTTDENTSLAFNTANSNQLSIVDVDAGTGSLTANLSVTNGTLSTGGAATTSISLTDTLTNVNTSLANLVFTPDMGFNGDAVLTLTVDDGGNTGSGGALSDTESLTISVRDFNDPPVAANDSVSLAEGNTLTFDPTADNGNGADSAGPNEGSQTLTVSIASSPLTTTAGGSVSLSGGQFTYTPPNAEYNGSDSFVYTITDNGQTDGANDFKSDSATVSVTVTEVNDAPTAGDDEILEPLLTPGTDVTIPISTLLSNDSPGPNNESGQTLTVTSTATSAGGGATSVSGANIIYTPPVSFSQSDTFTYTISDNGTTNGAADPLTATATVTVRDFIPQDLSGQVFLDIDADGTRDTGERGIGGVTITLAGTDLLNRAVSVTTRTQTDGTYEFTGVLPGNYTVTQSALSHFVPTQMSKDISVAVPNDINFNGALSDFWETSLQSEFLAISGGDLFHLDGAGNGNSTSSSGLLFATDSGGNMMWYVDVGGWDSFTPNSVTNNTVSVTNTATTTTQTFSDANGRIRSKRANDNSSTFYRIIGAPSDFTMAAGEGEGEMGEGEAPEAAMMEMLAADAAGDQFAEAVDAVFAEAATA